MRVQLSARRKGERGSARRNGTARCSKIGLERQRHTYWRENAQENRAAWCEILRHRQLQGAHRQSRNRHSGDSFV